MVRVQSNSMEMKWKGKGYDSVIHAKFAPNSELFALADTSHKIYIYSNKDRCESFQPRLTVLIDDFHKAPITSIDFSKDSYYIQTSSADYEHFRCKFILLKKV